MPLAELFADPPIPGQTTAWPLATLAAPVNTTPARGTVETWTFSQSPPGFTDTGRYRFVIDNEICIDVTGGPGTARQIWRGAEGTTPATHAGGTSIFHTITSQALSPLGEVFHAVSYGVKADGKTITDAQITAGQSIVTSPSGPFKSTDVGKLFVFVAAGTPTTSTTTGGLTSGVGFTAIGVNALGNSLPPGGLQITSGANTQKIVTSGALAGATSIPLIGTYVSATSAALGTGGPITSIPCAPLPLALPSGTVTLSYIDSSGLIHTQTFTTTGAALQATSIPVSSQTPNYAFPVSTTILGSPTSVSANFSYPVGSTVSTMVPALSTTIASYQSPTQVTLTAPAGTTVTSSGEAFYATDDTVALQKCVSDADGVTQHGTVQLPEGDIGLIAAITYSTSVTIRGVGVKDLLGANGVYGPSPSMTDACCPNLPPYLGGSVLVQCSPNTDGIQSNVAGQAAHVEMLGIRFAGRYQNTGHGLNFTQATGFGDVDGNFIDVHVFGVDGNHSGFALTATMLNRMTGLRSYGGGGMWLSSGNAPGQPGNMTVSDCFFNTYIAGIGHALFIDGSGTGVDYSAILMANANSQVNVPNPGIANTVTPTSAQQCIMTIDWSTMAQMGFDMPSAQSQVSGSNCTFPASGWTYRTVAPSNATINNPYPTTAPSSGSGVQNLRGTSLVCTFMFQMQPAATGSPSTTLSGVQATGTTGIAVVSSVGFSVGQVIQIGDASHDSGLLDYGIITSIAGNTLNILYPGNYGLSFNHSAGATVQAGAAVVYAQIGNGNSWPSNIRPMYIAAPVGAPDVQMQGEFELPSGWWYRLDFAGATRAWGTIIEK